MNKIAEYALIFQTGTSDEWVEKRINAVADIKKWLVEFSHTDSIINASSIASAISSGEPLPDAIAVAGEEMLREHAKSFVRTSKDGELEIKVIMAAAAEELICEADLGGGWDTADALAAAFWSALWFQQPVEQAKLDGLRQNLLRASRIRVLKIAESARVRRPIPPIGPVNIDQSSTAGARVNAAFSRAVEPMVLAMRDNASLDREELDFLWWMISERSNALDEPLSALSNSVRAVCGGIDAAAKLRRLPADAHRNIVLRNVVDDNPLSLAELLVELGDRRTKLAESIGHPMHAAPAVFPLLIAISTGESSGALSTQKYTPSDWGARALLEGSIHYIQTNKNGGL